MLITRIAQTTARGTYAEIQAAAAASALVVGYMYVSTDGTGFRWFLARTTSQLEEVKQTTALIQSVEANGGISLVVDAQGKLTATLVPSADANNAIVAGTDGKPYVALVPDFVRTVSSTTTAIPVVDAVGDLSVGVKVSTAARQAVTVDAEGLFVQKLEVAAASANLASIDADGKLSITAQRIVEFHPATNYATIADFVTAYNTQSWTPATGKELGTGDVVMLNTGGGNWAYTGARAATTVQASDFITIEGGEYTQDEVRTWFSAGASLVYTPATGIFALQLSTTTGNNLSLDATDNSIFLNVGTTAVSTTNNLGNAQNLTVSATFDDIYSQIQATVTTASNGITKTANDVKLGGVLTENTTIDATGKTFAFDGGNLNVASLLFLPYYTTNADGSRNTRIGTGFAELFIDQFGQLNVVGVPN